MTGARASLLGSLCLRSPSWRTGDVAAGKHKRAHPCFGAHAAVAQVSQALNLEALSPSAPSASGFSAGTPQRLQKGLQKTRRMERALRVIPGQVTPSLSRARWITQDCIAESFFTKTRHEHRSPCDRLLAKKAGWTQTHIVAGCMACLTWLAMGNTSFPETPQGDPVGLIRPCKSHVGTCSQAAVSWSPVLCNAMRIRVYLMLAGAGIMAPTQPLESLDCRVEHRSVNLLRE